MHACRSTLEDPTFCEKIRWALDFKGINYRPVCVNPFTRRELSRISEYRQVPVIRDGDKVVCDSSEIVAYLDRTYPEPPLVPASEPDRGECLAIERIADEEVGPAVRRLAYDALLRDKQLFAKVLLPRKGARRLLNPLRRPVAAFLIKRHFGITRARTDADRHGIGGMLGVLQDRLDGRAHFVGDSLTIADIAVASIMSPLELVEEFSRVPRFDGIFSWMRRLQEEHRRRRWTRA